MAALVLAVLGLAGPAEANHRGSPSATLNLVGSLDLGLPGENVTDVWAYGDHAYLGTFDDGSCSTDRTGVHIVDISDPASPTKVGFIPSPPGTRANDVKIAHLETRYFSGEILVHSNEACGSPFVPRDHSNGAAFPPGQGARDGDLLR